MVARIECPACRSTRVEPLRRAPVSGGAAVCGLRCAECASCWRLELGPAAQRDLDAAQRTARAALSDAYAASVSTSMTSLAEALGAAVCGLRCAECASCWRLELGPAAQRDLDAAQRAARAALSDAYAASVSASMTSLAEALGAALERDLLGPEDFDPRPPALS